MSKSRSYWRNVTFTPLYGAPISIKGITNWRYSAGPTGSAVQDIDGGSSVIPRCRCAEIFMRAKSVSGPIEVGIFGRLRGVLVRDYNDGMTTEIHMDVPNAYTEHGDEPGDVCFCYLEWPGGTDAPV